VQANESYSRAGTIRGLHFQWNPYMGKLVRTIQGHMVDIVLDIRQGSPTLGRALLYEMASQPTQDCAEWIWVPPGFAHGNYFTADTHIEYFCTGEYSPRCEAAISPLSHDIDWSLADAALKNTFDRLVSSAPLIADKDRQAPGMRAWSTDARAGEFTYGRV
jgi:dTDP-4-dehydrorhamnose 3,5-epimerase